MIAPGLLQVRWPDTARNTLSVWCSLSMQAIQAGCPTAEEFTNDGIAIAASHHQERLKEHGTADDSHPDG